MENRAKSYLQTSSGQRHPVASSLSKVCTEELNSKNERLARMKKFLKKDTPVANFIERQLSVSQARTTQSNLFMIKQTKASISHVEQSKNGPFSLAALDRLGTIVVSRHENPHPRNSKVLSELNKTSFEKKTIVQNEQKVAMELLDEVLDLGQDSIHQSLLDTSQKVDKGVFRSTFQDLNKGKKELSSTRTGWNMKITDRILSKDASHRRLNTASHLIAPKLEDPKDLMWADLLNTTWELETNSSCQRLPKQESAKASHYQAKAADSSYPPPIIPVRLRDYIGIDTSCIEPVHDWWLRGKFAILLKTTK